MTNSYRNLPTRTKRLIWVGYIAYLVWVNLLGGWDMIFDAYFKPITNNDFIDLAIMLVLYWAIVFLILWAWEGSD